MTRDVRSDILGHLKVIYSQMTAQQRAYSNTKRKIRGKRYLRIQMYLGLKVLLVISYRAKDR